MKKTTNINLAGLPFTIDDDAYNLLNDYLDTIRYAFQSKDDTEELADDIETRIAEILFEADPDGRKIITIEDVSNVIKRIGKPEEIIEIEDIVTSSGTSSEENIEIKPHTTPPPVDPFIKPRRPFYKKKLYRDPQNAMLGGVCSGIAHYINIDPTFVRLLTVVLLFLSASVVGIAYIILWIVVPEARTPYQRMLMLGKDPTVENIGKTVTENFQDEDKPNFSLNKTGFSGFLSTIFSIFAKFIVIVCFIIGIPILLVLFLVLVACIIAFFAAGGALLGGGLLGETVEIGNLHGADVALYLLLAAIGAIITIGIPFFLLIRMAFRKKTTNLSTNKRINLLIIWLIGIALTSVFTVMCVKRVKHMEYDKIKPDIEKLKILNSGNKDEIESIKLDNEGITITKKDSTIYQVHQGKVAVKKIEIDEKIDSIIADLNERQDSIKNLVSKETIMIHESSNDSVSDNDMNK